MFLAYKGFLIHDSVPYYDARIICRRLSSHPILIRESRNLYRLKIQPSKTELNLDIPFDM